MRIPFNKHRSSKTALIEDLLKILVNKRKAKGNSYKIVSVSQNKIEINVVLSDTKPEINNECKTPTKNAFLNVDLSLDSISKSNPI